MIGARLKLARTAAGLSLRDLALKIGGIVTAQAIGKYERNEARPGTPVLEAMAAALDVSPDYLMNRHQVTLEGVDFRKKLTASRREEAQVEAKVLNRLGEYIRVEQVLGLDSVRWERPPGAPYPLVEIAQAEPMAQSLREAWGLGRDPIPNLIELLEEKGIKVICEPLAEAIDGMTAKVKRTIGPELPVIVVNAKHAGERQRFTLAHELGHVILSPRGPFSARDVEKAAHRFAGAFLMPAETMWTEMGRSRTSISFGELFALKSLLGVSVQALTYRSRELGIISDALFRKLFEEYARFGWRSPPYEEPHGRPREAAKRMKRLCYRAVEEALLSVSDAAQALGIEESVLTEQMNEPWKLERAAQAVELPTAA
jgi:Zn-dependent peptidase ImmA (M78 family)/transcriptional regulator with XRE-family HTH domain